MTRDIDKTFTENLVAWYSANKRDLPWRCDKEPYHVWVSEIMLQQTRVEAVKEYYRRFMEALPDVKALAEAEEQELLKLWQGLGYYNRARNLQKAAKIIWEEKEGKFPDIYDEIRDLPGIGDYTAGAIASICFDQKKPAVDGNVLRIMSRLTEDRSDIKTAAVKRRFSAYLEKLYPDSNCGDFTQGLIELGALVCIPNGRPQCDRCPVAEYCKARAKGTESELPVKSVKKERKKEEKTVFILICADRVAVRNRPAASLLAGLYEFPTAGRRLTASEAVSQAEAWGLRPTDLILKSEYTHIFSHVEWKMTGYHIQCAEAGGPFRWATEKEMEEEIPLPSAFQHFWKKNP